MSHKSLTIYKASAGSGKTYKLTQHYLSLALSADKKYTKILAITFTRKATAEMRKRIVDELSILAGNPQKSAHAETLCSELEIDLIEIQQRASKLLASIIHDYSNFSVTTIDQFFQRIIRSVTKELGIAGNYRIEMDEMTVLTKAIDSMLESAMTIEPLATLLSEYIKNQVIADGKSHIVHRGIVEFTRSMLREDLKDSFIKFSDSDFDQQIIALQHSMTLKTRNFEAECAARFQRFDKTLALNGMK